MHDSPYLVAYLIGVAVLGLGVLLRILAGLARAARRNRENIKHRRRFDAVYTDTPLEDPLSKARSRALDSIESQFTVTRRALIPLVLFFTLCALALPFLQDIPATFVSIAVAAITLIVGIAARPFVENAIAGVVISTSRLINIGDTVKLGEYYGTVEDITATHTSVKIWDWRRFVVPNAEMLRSSFVNYSLYDRFVWASVEFWVGYDADLDRVQALCLSAATSSERFANYEEPDFWVMGMDKDGVRCMTAAWATTPADAWLLTHDIRSFLVTAFHKEGIWAQAPQRIEARVEQGAQPPVPPANPP